MRRLLTSCLGLALGCAGASRAEEVIWRSSAAPLPPQKITQASHRSETREPRPAPPSFLPDLNARGRAGVVPVRDSQPRWELIGPPRPLENPIPGPAQWSPFGTVQHSPSPDGRYNLVGEHGIGDEPPPVDPGSRFYFKSELLLWWLRGMKAPPLVGTGTLPPPGTFTGLQNPQVLYGGGPIGNPFTVGARFSGGMWLDCCHTAGIDGSLFFLGRQVERFRADSNQFPVLTRPFFAGNNFPRLGLPRPLEEFVAFPPGFTFPPNDPFFPNQPLTSLAGTIDVTTRSSLWGTDLNVREALKICSDECKSYRVDLLAGFRFLDLEESLQINENTRILNDVILNRAPGTRLFLEDLFYTRNRFYGGQLGFDAEWRRGRFFATWRSTTGIGGTHQRLLIDGFFAETPPVGPMQVFRGGLLALDGANIGTEERTRFSYMSENTLNFGVNLRPGLRAFAGYNLIYWTNVIRPSKEIDVVLDITRIPRVLPANVLAQIPPLNPVRPMRLFRQQDFWAQGLNLGLEAKY